MDQNLDAQNRPDDPALFNESLLRESVYTVCLAAYQNFEQKKQNWRHGGPESRRSEPPRRFSPFQQITTNPGYCVNSSIPSAQLPIRTLNKKRQNWCHGGLESWRSEPPRRQPLLTNHYKSRLLRESVHTVPGCLSEFWTKPDETDSRWTRI